ncbi:MAG: alpha/beta hydrolase [Myxococcota bacterium]|nr:alpha/beta hydrolase [Myxococcota bacterium]
MATLSDLKDIKTLINTLTPRTLPKMAFLTLEDLRLTNVREGGIREDAVLTEDMRYPAPAQFPLGAENAHGEIEMLGEVEATHWYAEADGITWHFVTTGDPKSEPLVIVHGFPESWYTFHNQVRDLSDQFYCVAVDVIGNGQSDKRLDLDYSYPGIAKALAKLLDTIGIEEFNLGGHDRGSVICDNLLGVDGLEQRVLRYVRMQQSANEPHGEPVPPHQMFASPLFPKLMRWTGFPRMAYAASAYRVDGISPEVLARLDHECKFKGVAEASPQQFKTTSFEQELEDRHTFLFAKMTMPVLFLQGRHDPGQHPEEYERTPEFVSDGRVQFIDGNHFFQLGAPEETSAAMRAFLSEPRARTQAEQS